jgi:hypothetical protein
MTIDPASFEYNITSVAFLISANSVESLRDLARAARDASDLDGGEFNEMVKEDFRIFPVVGFNFAVTFTATALVSVYTDMWERDGARAANKWMNDVTGITPLMASQVRPPSLLMTLFETN